MKERPAAGRPYVFAALTTTAHGLKTADLFAISIMIEKAPALRKEVLQEIASSGRQVSQPSEFLGVTRGGYTK
jgi:hypothetical protein